VAEMMSLAKTAHASAIAPTALDCCHHQPQRTRVKSGRGLLTKGPLLEGLSLGHDHDRTLRQPSRPVTVLLWERKGARAGRKYEVSSVGGVRREQHFRFHFQVK